MVIGRARSFLSEHAIDHGRFIKHLADLQPSLSSVNPSPLATPPPPGTLESRLRDRMHRVIEAMTVSELLELRVPSRFTLQYFGEG